MIAARLLEQLNHAKGDLMALAEAVRERWHVSHTVEGRTRSGDLLRAPSFMSCADNLCALARLALDKYAPQA